MSKFLAKVAGLVAVLLVLFGGVAQAATTPTSATGSASRAGAVSEPDSGSGETRAVVVGGLAFVLMVGTAGAVLWYTARGRRVTE